MALPHDITVNFSGPADSSNWEAFSVATVQVETEEEGEPP